jgi:4-aminobutyrate aminotransferase-like enzyme
MILKPLTSFSVEMNEKDFTMIVRALGYMAGIEGVTPKDDDPEKAAELNKRMLTQQASYYRTVLSQVEGKLSKV